MDKCILTHCALYAKFWYKKTNLIEDIKKCIAADMNFDVEYVTLNDIISILTLKLSRFHYLYLNQGVGQFTLDLYNHTDPKNTWKVGYYHKDNDKKSTNEYSREEAIIHYFMSQMRQMEKKDFINDLVPDKQPLPFNEIIEK